MINRVSVSNNGCWEWDLSRNKSGYGTLQLCGEGLAHRVFYRLFCGEIPDGLLVCHHCDNPPCCHPDHLFLGDSVDNGRDCIMKERHSNAKLSIKRALELKQRYDRIPVIGSRKLRGQVEKLALEFGISKSQMHRLKNGERWAILNEKHLQLSHAE